MSKLGGKREMKVRYNDRGVKENFSSGEHKNIATLKQEKTLLNEAGIDRYLSKDIAPYPEAPEFHLSKVAHVTTKRGLDGILKSGGFKGGEKSFLWCNLPVDDDDIIAAERRYLEKIFPDRTPEQRQIQQPFLSKFTTSPAFRKASRFGNFRFTFSLSDFLMMYSQQICGGKQPVLRVYETVVYKQEIMYTVLVHSPDDKEFEKYPVLGDGSDDALCAYMRGDIVWRAQAMSKTHAFGLAIEEVNQNVGTEGGGNAWYMWDHVTLAFHLPDGQALHFDTKIVIKNLTTCDADEMFIGVKCRKKGHECVGTCPCGKCLVPLATADEIVEGISCDYKTNC
ncbi:uncharacterized protein LOC109891194 [Oncorhynchus kisutch]|uniref:uncharacterized protein LOC109891194 n=1 Tax=Oncorhynchus kisutch TaxID=8019 RepID=UPI00099F6A52|nr:uncharacterized protein LOC109891194 [Oncorhynchus kisutch]